MLKHSLRLDGRQVQDSYELRLDASLPRRDSRDRDPGVGGCRGQRRVARNAAPPHSPNGTARPRGPTRYRPSGGTRPLDGAGDDLTHGENMGSIEDRMTLACPHCAREFTKSLDRLRSEPAVVCPICRASTGIDVGDFLRVLLMVDDALDAMGAALAACGGRQDLGRSCAAARS